MFELDMRTALFSYMLISFISTFLVALITRQFSDRYKGVYHLFFCFLLQAFTLLLILLRGSIPDWMSFDLSNSLSIAGIIFFLVGIENYTGQKSSLKPNVFLLFVFILVHTWFTFIKPDLSIRHLNVSTVWLILFLQSSILLLIRIPGSGVKRILPMTVICISFCIVCCIRIVKYFGWGHSDDYFQSDLFDIIIIVVCQILLILLMFSLAYMFGGRLFDDMRAEEEKFSKIFHTSPYSILLSRLSDGTIIEVNRVFLEKTGYNYSEIIGKTTLETHIWADYEDRTSLINALEKHERVSGKEIIIRIKTGELITALLTSELITVNNEACIFSSFEDISDRKLIEKEKEKSRDLLEKLNQHLVAVRENERKKIAMALHDDLGQRLTGLYLDIAWLKNKMTHQPVRITHKLNEITLMINETIENVKETSAFLRPSMLFELGLIPAIRSHLKKFEKQSGISYSFHCEPDHFYTDDHTSLVIFRVLQESLTNIARHSNASQTEIRLQLCDDVLNMTIADNGAGITADQLNSLSSMGIAGMRERIRAASGKIDITGESGNGTIVSVTIPLNKIVEDEDTYNG